MTAADSDMKKVGNSFLQLKLVLNKGGKTEDVFMGEWEEYALTYCSDMQKLTVFQPELTLNQFYTFLHEMEKVKSSLEYFS